MGVSQRPLLGVPRPVFQSVEKYCRKNFQEGAGAGRVGRESGVLTLLCLTDLQGTNDTTDILFRDL
jgi:hypothetical protein